MRLYKYLPPTRIDVLRNLRIRFSSPRVLNDPFELKPVVTGLAPNAVLLDHLNEGLNERVVADYEKLPTHVRALISLDQFQAKAREFMPNAEQAMLVMAQMATPMIQQQLEEKICDVIGILCLTTSPDNLLMWAHYADAHRGFLIEFDSESPFFHQQRSENDEFGYLREVRYQQDRPNMLMSEMEAFHVFLTKGLDWKYEAEWRMLQPLSSAETVLAGENEAIHLFQFPGHGVTSLILGSRMSEANKLVIQEVAQMNKDLNHVSIKQAAISPNEYKILISD
jgi:hypothetical protein